MMEGGEPQAVTDLKALSQNSDPHRPGQPPGPRVFPVLSIVARSVGPMRVFLGRIILKALSE